MKPFAEDLLRAISTFGIAASVTAGTYMIASGTRFTSDDSYVFGMSVGVIVASILLITLVCERVWKKKTALWVCAALYAALTGFATFVMATAELHGPSIAAIILGGAVLLGALELCLLRRVRSLLVSAVGLPLALAFVAVFAVV